MMSDIIEENTNLITCSTCRCEYDEGCRRPKCLILSQHMGFLLYFPVCPSGDLNKYVCVFQVKNRSYFGWAEWNFKSAARNDLSCFADRKMALALPLLSFLKSLNWRQLLFILLKFISLIPRSRRLNIFIS